MFQATFSEPPSQLCVPLNNYSHFPFFLDNKTLALFPFLSCHDLQRRLGSSPDQDELCRVRVHHGDGILMAKSLV